MARPSFLLSALALSALSGPAFGQVDPAVPAEPGSDSGDRIVIVPVEPMPGSDMFRRMDSDGDGAISKDEAQANNIYQNFDQFDTNKDGELSDFEFHVFAVTPSGEAPAVGAPPAGDDSGLLTEEEITRQFKGLDTNDDDYLNEREAAAEPGLLSSGADTNNDRRVDLDEYKDAHRAVGVAPGGDVEGMDMPEPKISY